VGNWREQINKALDASAAVIILLDPGWVETLRTRPEGDDEMRYEIAESLRRRLILLPVTLSGEELPDRNALPDDIAGLCDHECYQLLGGKLWKPTVDLLINDLSAALEASASGGDSSET
jgi:hypothetical protein